MAIIIELNVKPVEFDINGLTYKAPKSDDKLKAMDEIANNAQEVLTEVNAGVRDLANLRAILISGLDSLLGEGSFKQIEQSLADDDSEYTIFMGNIFFQVINEYRDQMNQGFDAYQREE